MNIDHLFEFIEFSRQLNFTSTAKKLHMTQPALSNHILAIEKEVGALLVERSQKTNVRLTPSGQLFLDTAKQIVSLYENTLGDLKKLQQDAEGKLVIRSPRHEYSYPLLNYIFEFQERHPAIDVVIHPWSEVDGIDDVVSGSVDCAYVGYGDYQDDTFEERYKVKLAPYASAELLLWIDKDHPLASKGDIPIQSLSGCNLLIPANKKNSSWLTGIGNIINRYDLSCEINEKYCDSLEDLILTKTSVEDVLICDSGLLNFPPFMLKAGRIIKPFTPRVKVPISLGYRNEKENKALQLFIEFLLGKFLEVSSAKSGEIQLSQKNEVD